MLKTQFRINYFKIFTQKSRNYLENTLNLFTITFVCSFSIKLLMYGSELFTRHYLRAKNYFYFSDARYGLARACSDGKSGHVRHAISRHAVFPRIIKAHFFISLAFHLRV